MLLPLYACKATNDTTTITLSASEGIPDTTETTPPESTFVDDPTSATQTNTYETTPPTTPEDTPATQPPTQQTTPPTLQPPTTDNTTENQDAPESDLIASGTCVATNGKWKITKDGTLTVYGNDRPENKSTYTWSPYADQVTKIVFEPGITHVPENAFFGFKKVTEVVLSDSVETIGKDAFSNCSALSKIVIPKNVKVLEQGTFTGCSSLTSLSYAPDCQLTTINSYVFGTTALKEFTAPPNLTTIKPFAFANSKDLETVILDGSQLVIDNYAFKECRNLKNVVLGSGITRIASNAFSNCYSITNYESYAPVNIELKGLTHLTTVIIGGDVTKLPRFTNCSRLSSVTINAPITKISTSHFMGCSALTTITIPNTVKTIEDNAFVASGIRELIIPSSVEEMGWGLFNTTLQKITFIGDPPIFKSIDTKCTFTGLDTLTAYYPADNPAWTQEILQNYGAGEIIWIPQ